MQMPKFYRIISEARSRPVRDVVDEEIIVSGLLEEYEAALKRITERVRPLVGHPATALSKELVTGEVVIRLWEIFLDERGPKLANDLQS
jgi:hypothetical protein